MALPVNELSGRCVFSELGDLGFNFFRFDAIPPQHMLDKHAYGIYALIIRGLNELVYVRPPQNSGNLKHT